MSMSPHTETEPVVGSPTGNASTSRRSFFRTAALGAAALGAAAATGVASTSIAGAAEPMPSGGGGGAKSAAAEVPLSAVDTALLVFLHGISLAAQQAMQSGSDATYLSSATAERIREFSRHHREQAARLGKLLPADVASSSSANPTLLSQMEAAIGGEGSQSGLLSVLAGYEESLSATFIEALGQAEHFTVSEAIAGCAPILGQQAATFGADAGKPLSEWMPAFAPTAGALTQSAYPIR